MQSAKIQRQAPHSLEASKGKAIQPWVPNRQQVTLQCNHPKYRAAVGKGTDSGSWLLPPHLCMASYEELSLESGIQSSCPGFAID